MDTAVLASLTAEKRPHLRRASSRRGLFIRVIRAAAQGGLAKVFQAGVHGLMPLWRTAVSAATSRAWSAHGGGCSLPGVRASPGYGAALTSSPALGCGGLAGVGPRRSRSRGLPSPRVRGPGRAREHHTPEFASHHWWGMHCVGGRMGKERWERAFVARCRCLFMRFRATPLTPQIPTSPHARPTMMAGPRHRFVPEPSLQHKGYRIPCPGSTCFQDLGEPPAPVPMLGGRHGLLVNDTAEADGDILPDLDIHLHATRQGVTTWGVSPRWHSPG